MNTLKNILSKCFNKWWILPLISAALIGLSFIVHTLWLVPAGLLVMTVAIVYQLIKNSCKAGCLMSMLMLVHIGLALVWVYVQIFPSQERVHRYFAKQYEKRKEIQELLGVEIPKFKLVESQLKHFRLADFEFEVNAIIEFKVPPDDRFYDVLDSICALPMTGEPDEHSSYFYKTMSNVYRCWYKEGVNYKYNRHSDHGEKFLHSIDAYFSFEIVRGSTKAELVFGNY